MGGFIDLRVDIIKGGMDTYGVSENAIFMPGNTDPQYSEWLAFSGTSVTLDGEQKYLDSHLSYQRACLHAIDYLTKFGYSPEQAYLLLGAAPIEGRCRGVVDIPNSCSTVYLPTAMFDFPRRTVRVGSVPDRPGCRRAALGEQGLSTGECTFQRLQCAQRYVRPASSRSDPRVNLAKDPFAHLTCAGTIAVCPRPSSAPGCVSSEPSVD